MSVRNRRPSDLNDTFERERQDSLRSFEVEMEDGSYEYVLAHQHDAGNNPAGNLNFITVSPEGRMTISHSFNGVAWRTLREVGSVLGRGVAAAGVTG